MHRNELLRRLVLNSICDDFENVDQIILPSVRRDGARLGLTIERSDIVLALTALVKEGMAEPYILRASGATDPFSGELPTMPCIDDIEYDFETYFYITPKGMEFHLANDSWWPFEDE